jgi:hypothetical protein
MNLRKYYLFLGKKNKVKRGGSIEINEPTKHVKPNLPEPIIPKVSNYFSPSKYISNSETSKGGFPEISNNDISSILDSVNFSTNKNKKPKKAKLNL